MKIAFCYGNLQRGGAQRVICCLANDFLRRGDQVSILTLNDGETEYELSPEVKVTGLGVSGDSANKWESIRRFLNTERKLSRWLAEEKPDAVLAFSSKLTMQLMREPTLSELAECLGWDEARTLDTLLSLESGRGVSLDEEAGEGEIPLHEMLGAEDQHITSAADYASVKALLDALPPRDARLLTLRYLENRSQRDTARALDMTQMQVHRAEKRLLALLRERLEGK